MAVYIKLNEAVEAFKKAEADDKDFVKFGIFDDVFVNTIFPAQRAIKIICKCHKYLSKDYEPEN